MWDKALSYNCLRWFWSDKEPSRWRVDMQWNLDSLSNTQKEILTISLSSKEDSTHLLYYSIEKKGLLCREEERSRASSPALIFQVFSRRLVLSLSPSFFSLPNFRIYRLSSIFWDFLFLRNFRVTYFFFAFSSPFLILCRATFGGFLHLPTFIFFPTALPLLCPYWTQRICSWFQGFFWFLH